VLIVDDYSAIAAELRRLKAERQPEVPIAERPAVRRLFAADGGRFPEAVDDANSPRFGDVHAIGYAAQRIMKKCSQQLRGFPERIYD
jgi:hypothetical protein